ncbi:DUF1073 domain-containing protein [Profundibacterium mesophilum]|uniref:Selenide water dikinase n=1 Tax=Profundibacterium mesophilum KAUST100406-0324 TaxID=1037889 RepID=A0A921NX04_9RHOB|nr:anti-CBASS Acb1 family protein [Profundibacterium mesophilum]KAF0675083.1 selenide water dikinase [Profundibacterium mesophilum KAUST100406-0324]
MRLMDGLVNLVSGMGTGRDKATGASYTHRGLSPAEIMTAYKGSALVRRVVDLPAEDAVREWREWQAEADQISRLEAEEDRLGLKGKVLEARKLARLMGGAAIMIGDGATDPAKPLQPARSANGGLRYLTVLEQDEIAPGPLGMDVMRPDFRLPLYWTVNGTAQRIHPTRLAMFWGMPRLGTMHDASTMAGRGGSVLNGMLETVRNVDEVAANVLSLVYEAKVDVFGVPNLMENLRSRGDRYAEEVLSRTRLAATAKGINGMLIRDAEETYEQKSASFGALPDVMDRFMQLASAASGVPMTLLFGISPGGMNATGESDVRAYYDRVRVQQSLYTGPAMAALDEALIYSALGERPRSLHYTWRPLWQPTAAERANVGKTVAETMQIAAQIGDLSPEVISAALVNGLTETGAFPGLEAAAAEFRAIGGTEPDEFEE